MVMATSLLFGACSGDGKTCDRATQQKGNTENVIGRSDIKVKDGRMTPEVLWAMGRIGGMNVSPDGQKVVPFAGNAEGRDIMSGEFDVIVTDGFTGNVVLKFGEGAASLFSALLKKSVEKGGLRAKLGAFLLKPALKKYLVKRLDYAEYGGAPLMGIKGGLIICHGASQARAIRNAIHMAKDFCEARVVDVIAEAVVQIEKEAGRLKED